MRVSASDSYDGAGVARTTIETCADPLLVAASDRLLPALLTTRGQGAPLQETAPLNVSKLARSSLTNHAVLVGHGRVGSLVAKTLDEMGQCYLVVEERQAAVEQAREKRIEVILGNAAQPGMLDAANVIAARFLISAIPNPFETGNLIERARAANPQLEIIARAHSDAEVDYLAKLGASRIITGEREMRAAFPSTFLAVWVSHRQRPPVKAR